MNQLINYSKVNIYFPLMDDITQDIVKTFTSLVMQVNSWVHEVMDKELTDLIETNKSIETMMLENEYTIKLYHIVFSAVYEAKIDATPILHDILLRHDLKNLTSTQIEQYFSNKTYNETCYSSIKRYLNELVDSMKLRTTVQLLKQVVLNTKEVEYVRTIANFVFENLDKEKKEDLTDLFSTIRTLRTFGGTIPQAKELVTKYIA